MNSSLIATERDVRTERIIGAAVEVHRMLGPGLLESAYESCLCHELDLRNISYAREVPLPVEYKGMQLECGYRMDLVVNDEVVVELKCVDKILPIHKAQLITYLRLSGKTVGLLINFHSYLLRDGIVRLVL
jgi:GxxExxY protein